MIGTVRKHQTWLWAVIITITIVSFVFFFSPTSKLDMAHGSYNFGTIKGEPISREDFLKARNEMLIYYRLRFRDWPKSEEMMKMMGFDLEHETYSRLALIEKMRELKIEASPATTAAFLADIFRSEDRPGAFPIEEYRKFIKEQLEPRGLTSEDFERFAAHEAGQQQLMATFGVSGRLVTNEEARYAYQRENETMLMDAALFSASNYLSQVKVDDSALTQYFNLNKAKYRVPDKIQVEYVKIPLSSYFAKADEELGKMTNFNMVIERTYFERGSTNYYKDEKGRGLSLEEAKPKIKTEIREYFAAGEAKKAAAALINQLFAHVEKNPDDKTALSKTASAKNLTVTETPLFDERTGPKDLKVPAAFRTTAFRLTEQERYASSPIVGDDAVYVIGLKKKVPGYFPELTAVKSEVVDDFKHAEATKLARKAGDDFAAAAAKGLKEGKKFEAIAIEQKVKPVSLPAFSLNSRVVEGAEKIGVDRLQNAAGRLAPQQSSDLLATEDGGAVLYLRERKAVDAAKMSKELAEFTTRLRDERQFVAYRDWLQKLPQELQLTIPSAAASAKNNKS